MAWTSTDETNYADDEPGHLIRHHDPVSGLSVEVDHFPGAFVHHTHNVLIDNGGGMDKGFRFPAQDKRHVGKAYLGKGEYGPPPSQELLTMIENHHQHHQNPGALAALLDKLVEEYPSLDAAVQKHTAARYT